MINEQVADLDTIIKDNTPEVLAYTGTEQPEEEAKAPEIDTGEVIAQLLMPTFGLIALKAGAHWNLTPEEAQIAGNAYGEVVDKYFPDAGQSMGVEVTALIVTAGLVAPRLVMRETPPPPPQHAQEPTKEQSTVVDFQGIKNTRGSKDGD